MGARDLSFQSVFIVTKWRVLVSQLTSKQIGKTMSTFPSRSKSANAA